MKAKSALSRGCPPWLTPPRLCNGARGKVGREVWLLGGFIGRESGTAMEIDVILLDCFDTGDRIMGFEII